MVKKKALLMITAVAVTIACALSLGCTSGTNNEKPSGAGANSSTLSKNEIEEKLNIRNIETVLWEYDIDSGTWAAGPITYVASPEAPEGQCLSICIPEEYVEGIDTNGDGETDVDKRHVSDPVKGNLVLDYDNGIESPNGQIYKSSTAPILLDLGSDGYGSSSYTKAKSEYAECGYISVACCTRSDQDGAKDSGEVIHTGDAPEALVDQKAAARFIKYNIMLGNLPGDADKLVVAGDGAGGTYATLFAATGNSSDFYPYLAEIGAAGVYSDGKGGYLTGVTIGEANQALSDGTWGCVAYNAVSSIVESDMAQAFERVLNGSFEYASEYDEKLASMLAEEYMNYINTKNMSSDEATAMLDIDGNGKAAGVIELKVDYDSDKYRDTNGYGGSYINMYRAKLESTLQTCLDDLDYAGGWTWFDEEGKALDDEAVGTMSHEDRVKAFMAGRYAIPTKDGAETAGGEKTENPYSRFEEMLSAYETDLISIQKKDAYDNDIVHLYDPLEYIGKDGIEDPTWVRIVIDASNGDVPLTPSLNLQLAWASDGVDARAEWQWTGDPYETVGISLPAYIDRMFGYYAKDAKVIMEIEKEAQTTNGNAEKANGENISSWAKIDGKGHVSFSIKDAMSRRTANVTRSIPGFDTPSYGQEAHVFGSETQDARHWDAYLVDTLKQNKSELSKLFDASEGTSDKSKGE